MVNGLIKKPCRSKQLSKSVTVTETGCLNTSHVDIINKPKTLRHLRINVKVEALIILDSPLKNCYGVTVTQPPRIPDVNLQIKKSGATIHINVTLRVSISIDFGHTKPRYQSSQTIKMKMWTAMFSSSPRLQFAVTTTGVSLVLMPLSAHVLHGAITCYINEEWWKDFTGPKVNW